MIYTPENVARGAAVFDVEAGRVIVCVLAVSTDTGTVLCTHNPATLDEFGDLETIKLRFRSIYPLGGARPALFHCYGPM